MYAIIEVFVIISISLVVYLYYKLTFWKRLNVPNIIFHNIRAFFNQIDVFDQKCIQQNGKVVGTYELLRPVLMVAEPELINEMLITKFKCFANRRDWVLPQNHFGSGILFNEYEDWKRIRSVIKKSFADSYLKKMTYIIEESIEHLIQTLNPIAMNCDMTDMVKHLSAFNLNITLRTFFGVNLEKLSPKIYENATKISNPKITIEKLFALLFPKISNAFGIEFADKKATNFLIDLTKDIINQIKGTETERNDMLRFMLRANNKTLTQKEIIDNCLSFLVAGHETTTSALCHLIYCLALNPDKQSKLFREIDLNWNKNLLSFENADQIKYLDACIKESLRLIPTGVRIERRATNDCKLGNVFVPKNCLVTIPVFSVHRDPENFENPDDYIPERFLDPNQIKARTYLPFADGPRNCIGMRFAQILMKITTAKLLQKFSFVQCKQTKDLGYINGFPLKSPKQLWVTVITRQS